MEKLLKKLLNYENNEELFKEILNDVYGHYESCKSSLSRDEILSLYDFDKKIALLNALEKCFESSSEDKEEDCEFCDCCSETIIILSGESKITNINGINIRAFADLRLDLDDCDRHELDMQLGLINADTGEMIHDSFEWSKALEINFCPKCGKDLRK